MLQTTSLNSQLRHGISVVAALSRTAAGVNDTSVSPDKEPLVLQGPALAKVVRKNIGDAIVQASLAISERSHMTADDVREMFESAEAKVSNDLINGGKVRLRSWRGLANSHYIEPDKIPAALEKFYGEVALELNKKAVDWSALAAKVELEFNGLIHPLEDGCGRVSRCISVAMLAQNGLFYPSTQYAREIQDNYGLTNTEFSAQFELDVGNTWKAMSRMARAVTAALRDDRDRQYS